MSEEGRSLFLLGAGDTHLLHADILAANGPRSGGLVGMILVNLRFLVDRDGELRITWPDGHVSHEKSAAAFAAAG
jgi:hypothetical protein